VTGDTRAVIEGAWTSVPSLAVFRAATAAATLLPMTKGTVVYSLACPSAGVRSAVPAVWLSGEADETTVVTRRVEARATTARATSRRTIRPGRRYTMAPFSPK
jgi:hypothetical protein